MGQFLVVTGAALVILIGGAAWLIYEHLKCQELIKLAELEAQRSESRDPFPCIIK